MAVEYLETSFEDWTFGARTAKVDEQSDLGQRARSGDVSIAAARAFDVICIDVVAAGHSRVLGEQHSRVVEGNDVLVAVLLPVHLPISFPRRELFFSFQLIAELLQRLGN